MTLLGPSARGHTLYITMLPRNYISTWMFDNNHRVADSIVGSKFITLRILIQVCHYCNYFFLVIIQIQSQREQSFPFLSALGRDSSRIEGFGRQAPSVLAGRSDFTRTNAIGDIVCERSEPTGSKRLRKAGIAVIGQEPRGGSERVPVN